MQKNLILTIVTAVASIGGIAYAQDRPAPDPRAQQDQQQSESAAKTVKGCLQKGSQAQQYSIADDSSGETVSFAGPAKLDSYVNQTVEVSGQVVDRGGEKVFRPQSLKAVAASCSNAKQK